MNQREGIVGLGSATGLADHHHQSGSQPVSNTVQNSVHAVRVSVVEELNLQPLIVTAGIHQKSRTQRASARTDVQDIGKRRTIWCGNRARSDPANEADDPFHGFANGGSIGHCWRTLWGSKPVVPHLPTFIDIDNGP
jgi:hypothetical protein